MLVAVVYVASTVGVMSLLPRDALSVSTAPFVDAARTRVGEWAAGAVAAGAALSCFGALNGWTLLVGQLPLAVARDGLFPRIFARTSRRGTPAAGLIIAGVLTTALVCLNYTRGLVELFTFFILLSTLNTLIPYVFSSLALFLLPGRTAGAALPARHRGRCRPGVRLFDLGDGRRGRGNDLLGLPAVDCGSAGLRVSRARPRRRAVRLTRRQLRRGRCGFPLRSDDGSRRRGTSAFRRKPNPYNESTNDGTGRSPGA